jgi:hypothetical protein
MPVGNTGLAASSSFPKVLDKSSDSVHIEEKHVHLVQVKSTSKPHA